MTCANAVEALRALFVKLGYKIQAEKSVFLPAREITFLGYNLNSVTMKVYPTGEKIRNGLELIRGLRAEKDMSIRQLAGAIGVLNDLTKGCEYGMGHYRFLEKDKTRAMARNRGDFDATMTLSEKAKGDLGWWILNLHRAQRRIWINPPEMNSPLTLATMAGGLFSTFRDGIRKKLMDCGRPQRKIGISMRKKPWQFG